MKEQEVVQLVKKARLRNKDSFTRLMEYYVNDLYKVSLSILCNNEDAADAIQETILSCWEKIHTLKDVKYFKTWMTRILINHCYDIRKERMKLSTYEDAIYEETVHGVDKSYEIKEALDIVMQKVEEAFEQIRTEDKKMMKKKRAIESEIRQQWQLFVFAFWRGVLQQRQQYIFIGAEVCREPSGQPKKNNLH